MLIDHPQLPQALDSLDLSDITGIGARMLIRLKNHGILDVASLCQADRATLHRIWGRLKEIAFGTPFEALLSPNKVRANVALGIPTFYRQSLEPSLELFHIAPNARKSLPPPAHE